MRKGKRAVWGAQFGLLVLVLFGAVAVSGAPRGIGSAGVTVAGDPPEIPSGG
ncbi:hypothetical protein HNR42_003481 [Deinobacterium chartae]|uniref:Uncharacterized protein n=1 Tax=Deinobacterium chartae TaxID=521158 RepID=A0A841I4S2_9DEIO|nr:hypothetical protein [Deinobacterium chartae]MBB6100016.1 hypothetical protein [Deinobacterium chartae]